MSSTSLSLVTGIRQPLLCSLLEKLRVSKGFTVPSSQHLKMGPRLAFLRAFTQKGLRFFQSLWDAYTCISQMHISPEGLSQGSESHSFEMKSSEWVRLLSPSLCGRTKPPISDCQLAHMTSLLSFTLANPSYFHVSLHSLSSSPPHPILTLKSPSTSAQIERKFSSFPSHQQLLNTISFHHFNCPCLSLTKAEKKKEKIKRVRVATYGLIGILGTCQSTAMYRHYLFSV